MTDKDSQLDEIEETAKQWAEYHPCVKFHPHPNLFLTGGLYYEMRRENVRLKELLEEA